MNTRLLIIALLVGMTACVHPATAQTTEQRPRAERRRNRPTPPTRDPHTPGYVAAKELPDGEVPPADADGNFIIGPTHKPAPEMTRAGRRAAGRQCTTSR